MNAILKSRSTESDAARRGPLPVLATLVLFLALAATSSTACTSGGPAYTPGPGASYNTTFWSTYTRWSDAETLYVRGFGQLVGKANSCNYGLSVWYSDTRGVRRNLYYVRNGCTWGPTWWFTTQYFTAKRGTSVQATYRWDGRWYPGHTFRIH